MWEFFERLITIAVPRIRDSVACPLSLSTVVVTTAWVSGADHLPRNRLR